MLVEKRCKKCEIIKPIDEFYLRMSHGRKVRQARCKQCTLLTNSEWAVKNADKVKADRGIYYKKHKERLNALSREYHIAHKEEKTEYSKKYYQDHKEHLSAINKVYREDHKEELKEKAKVYKQNTYETMRAKWLIYNASEEVKIRSAIRRSANKEELKAYEAERSIRNKESNAEYYRQHREYILAMCKIYAKANPEVRILAAMKRRTAITKAGGFCTKDDIKVIEIKQNGRCTYCGADITKHRHRDHIVPVVKLGDSWPTNIQLLCKTCNLQKHALYHEEYMVYRELQGIETMDYAYEIPWDDSHLLNSRWLQQRQK